MDYIDLVKEIESQGVTKLPALLIVVAKQCVKKKVFQPGGMERVISRIASQPTVQADAECPGQNKCEAIGIFGDQACDECYCRTA